MSRFRKSGSTDIRDTFSLIIRNITLCTTADDLFRLFDQYGKVVDICIPRKIRNGASRGFAFVRYKNQNEAQKAMDRLHRTVLDRREISVKFAEYGPNDEKIHKGRIVETSLNPTYKSRGRSPRTRYRDDYKEKDHRRQRRTRSLDRYDRHRYGGRDRAYRRRSRSHSASRDAYRGQGRGRDHQSSSRSRRLRASPTRRSSPNPRRGCSPRRSSLSRDKSPDRT